MTQTPAPQRKLGARMRRRLCLAAGAALGVGLIGGRDSLAGPRPAAPVAASTPALGDRVVWPEISLLDGRRLPPLQAGELASVIVFFSTTCPYCARHNAHVQNLREAAAALPLRVLGVAEDREAEAVRRYAVRRGLNFDITLEAGTLHAALSPMRGIPLTCVVDRQQRLREVIRGEMFEVDVLGLSKWARS